MQPLFYQEEEMKKTPYAVLIILLVFISGVPTLADTTDNSSAEKVMDSVSTAIDNGDLELSLEKLEGIQKEGLTAENLSRLHFLQGKAVYIKVSADIKSCRLEGTQKRFELQEYQIEPLVSALNHLNKAYELSPDSDWAPEALYAAGLIQDSSCLQRFGGAMDSYWTLAEKYPDTDLGKAARQKYDYLRSRMDQKGHGQHP